MNEQQEFDGLCRSACEDFDLIARHIKWAWEGLENENAGVGENEEKMHTIANVFFDYLAIKSNELVELVYDRGNKIRDRKTGAAA
jgi:hypothetical protein